MQDLTQLDEMEYNNDKKITVYQCVYKGVTFLTTSIKHWCITDNNPATIDENKKDNFLVTNSNDSVPVKHGNKYKWI